MKHSRIIWMILMLCLLLQGLSPCAAATEGTFPFRDISQGDWFYDSVRYVYERQLMNGVQEDCFSPEGLLTRGMIVTVLHRMEGSPQAEPCSFQDVSDNAYYFPAVSWAYSCGIVTGYDQDSFGAEDFVTREQLITILYRYVSIKGGQPQQRANLNQFRDIGQISDYALSPVRWAVSVGLVNGRSDTTLVPGGTTTRAEFAALVHRLEEKVLAVPEVMQPNCVNIPILLFHSISDTQAGTYVVSTAYFRSVLQAFYDEGYQTVSYRQILDFVENGTPLPEKPFVISMDDGYRDNLTNGCPVMEEFDFCCEIAAIGSWIGLDSFGGVSLIPHFALEEVRDYPQGMVNVESHTMWMHMDSRFYPEGRSNVAQLVGESDEAYAAELLRDFAASRDVIAATLPAPVRLTYPGGVFTAVSEAAARAAGFRVTVSTRHGSNIITAGNPDSLYLLNRISALETIPPKELLRMVSRCQEAAQR